MYSEHLISFIDILGYSELVVRADCEEIERCIEVFLDAFAAEESDQILGRRTTYFSDTIITTIPVLNPDGRPQLHGTLFHELSALCLAQADLFDRLGIFVRGGVTVGDLVHEETRIFGPAVIRAHELEVGASFPRIVVGREVFARYFANRDLVANHHRRRSQDYTYIHSLLHREPNGDRCVDYLGQALHNLDKREYFMTLLTKHKNAVLKGLKHSSSSIRSKYFWLQRYHNETVRKTIPPEFHAGVLI